MRIGIDARLWNESGVGRYIRNLIAELAKIDKKNHYVLFFRSKEFTNILLPGKNFEKKLADVQWHTIEEQLRLPSILNKEKLDLVHFPYFSVPIFYARPFVVTIHDLILHHFPTGQASTLFSPLYWAKLLGYKFIIAQAAKRSRKIITVSNATKDEIIDHLGVSESKIVVTHEGIDEQILNSKSQILNKSKNSKFQIPNSKFFLYVGNAYPHKNLERLIEAFSRVKSHESRVKLVLVGKEDFFYRRLKEKVQKIGLGESVVFYGEATDEELIGLYKNALALIMPSLMEGFGLPALEAMSNKCLVLASNIPALREICGDAALYFNPFDVGDLTEKLKAIHSNDTYHYSKNIQKGIERAKMFSWEKMAKETLVVYESCIGL